MRGACTLYPVVKGKKSKLYSELYKNSGSNRKLSNFIYALSLQEDIKKLFVRSDLNSQGEPNFNVLLQKLGIENLFNQSIDLEEEAKKLGAVNSKGEIIYHNNPTNLTQKVLDFNDNNEHLKASIKNSKDGFYIEVDTVNAENFNTNNSIRVKISIYDAIIQHLKSHGLNTNISEEMKGIINIMNVYYFIETLKDFYSSLDNLSEYKIKILIELFSNDPFIVRLKKELKDDLASTMSYISGNTKNKRKVNVTTQQETLIKNFLKKASKQLEKIADVSTLNTLVDDARASVNYQKTFLNTDGLSIRNTLKELYKLYFLDKDLINSLDTQCVKVSQLAEKLLQIKLIILEEQRIKGKTVTGEQSLLNIQRLLSRGKYLYGLAKLLEDLSNGISTEEKKLEVLSTALKKSPNNMAVINNLSSIILRQLDLVESYTDLLEEIKQIEKLEKDTNEDSDLITGIIELASSLSSTLATIKNNARKKQFDTVYSFLKIYWGKDNKKLPDGTTVTLEDIMNLGMTDINIFDSFLYAATSTNDEMMNLIAEAVKRAQEVRDNILREKLRTVRIVTKALYDSGSDSKFMFEMDENGHPKRIISDYDYEKFESELSKYKESLKQDPNVEKKDFNTLVQNWIQKHSQSIQFKYVNSKGENKTLALTVPIFEKNEKLENKLSAEQYRYYKTMMNLKAEMIANIDTVDSNTLFDVIEISSNVTTALAESGGNPIKIYEMIRNKVIDAFKDREDDVDYGSILDANNLMLTHVNSRGEKIFTLPLFYTRKIQDRSRVSTDFSRSIMAYLATSEQYIQMNKILDSLLLAKNWMLNRKLGERIGESTEYSITKLGKKVYGTLVTKKGSEGNLKSLANDFFERVVYSRTKKNEGYLWGTKIRRDKIADFVTGYTSITGLTVNMLGAEANLLVGKIQMLIESGLGMGGEFFNFKDLLYSDAKYFQMLGPLLNEVNSISKSSLLGLLMEKFNVLDDFYEKVQETGFYKEPISKIIGNKSLFLLYGMGEHLLHAQGMIAVLHNKKNYILHNGVEVPILEAFDVVKDETGNGRLVIKEGYTKKDGSEITEEDLRLLKNKISYVNKTLHGAFGSFDKGMIHRYAIGRLIMNFRQWMPAHYSRRFRGLHYDTDLNEYREGYYVSCYKFIKDCASDLREHKLDIMAHWRDLDDMQKYNLKRAAAEVAILSILTASLVVLGSYKDKRGNWAYRHLIYELLRMKMEVEASSPIAGYGFVDNVLKVLNSPAAFLSTTQRISRIIKLTDLFTTIESGKYQGENLYVHNLEKNLPFVGHIIHTIELGESDDMFVFFN